MSISYQIKVETGRSLNFDIYDKRSDDLNEMSTHSEVPDWAKLEYHQCPVCPFDTKETKFCPAAFELQDVIAQCSDLISYERIELIRKSEHGSIIMKTDMQTALFAVIGERTISSACKVMNTRHWTLDYYSIIMTEENLFYRTLSSYLVQQFLLARSGQRADFQLNDYETFVNEIISVFGSLLERFRQVSKQDASNNAVVRLVMIGRLLQKRREKWISELKAKVGV